MDSEKYKMATSLEGLRPSSLCKKCGSKQWFPTEEPLSWSCVYCGNIIYLTYGTFRQQIEIVMQSKNKDNFVSSEDNLKLVPKKSEEYKKLKFKEEMEKRGKK